MVARKYSNIAVQTTLASGITSGETSLTVTDATGWPSAPFALLINEGESTEELILVGGKTGTTFSSLTRGYGGTSASAHSGGEPIKLVVTAEDFTFLWEHAHDGADDSAVVSHTDLNDLTIGDPHTQYLKEKASGGAASEVPEHDHDGASGAGDLDTKYALDSEVTSAVSTAVSTHDANASAHSAAISAHAADADAHHDADHAASHADGGSDEVSVTDLADYDALPRGLLAIGPNNNASTLLARNESVGMDFDLDIGSYPTGRALRIKAWIYCQKNNELAIPALLDAAVIRSNPISSVRPSSVIRTLSGQQAADAPTAVLEYEFLVESDGNSGTWDINVTALEASSGTPTEDLIFIHDDSPQLTWLAIEDIGLWPS